MRWVQTAASIPWKLDFANSTHRWIVYGKYEGAAFLNWAKNFLPRNGIVIDSGANIGQMSLYFSQFVPDGKVLAFEPGPVSADWLEECVSANALNNIEVIRLALGAEELDLSLQEPGVETKHGAQNHISESGGVPVKVVKLCDQVARRGIDRIDLWKLDVEGYEYEALQGAASLLQRKTIRALYVEIQDALQSKIIQYLREYDYTSYNISYRGQAKTSNRFSSHAMALFLPN